MNSREVVLSTMRAQGKADAADLRSRAGDMDGTAIIAEKEKVPPWDGEKDYSEWPVGAPVEDEGRTYGLLQPHDAAHYPDARPSGLPALWSIRHTKDPERAEPYLPPNGTSGLYLLDECCTKDGHLWRSDKDGNEFPPGEVGTELFWTDLGVV